MTKTIKSPESDEIGFVEDAADARAICQSLRVGRKRKRAKARRGKVFLCSDIEVPSELLAAKEIVVKELFGGHGEWTAAANAGRKGSKTGLENIIGVRIGQKRSKGKPTPYLCVVIEVLRKVDKAKLHRDFKIPSKIKVGSKYVWTDIQVEKRVTPHSIVGGNPCGINIPAGFVTGSIGFFCTVRAPNLRGCLLTNSHVIGAIADPNVQEGSDVLSPNASGTAIAHYFKSGDSVDAALAFVRKNVGVDIFGHEGYAVVSETADPSDVGTVEIFGGETNALRTGAVGETGITRQVNYETGVRLMENLFVIDSSDGDGLPFSSAADSGSGIVESGSGRPVGILIGANGPEGSLSSMGQAIDPIIAELEIEKILATK